MSDYINEQLIDLALEHVEFWGGGYWTVAIEKALEDNDLELLATLVKQSAREMALEYEVVA